MDYEDFFSTGQAAQLNDILLSDFDHEAEGMTVAGMLAEAELSLSDIKEEYNKPHRYPVDKDKVILAAGRICNMMYLVILKEDGDE